MQPVRQTDFMRVKGASDHGQRQKAILRAHPQVAQLFGYNRWSSVIIAALALMQNGIAFWLNELSIFWVVAAAYFVGSVVSLAIMALVHEASHKLVAKTKTGNNAALFVANLGILWPAALAYRRYHLNHHKYFGLEDGDVDMPTHKEAVLIGHSKVRKFLWLIFFPWFYTVSRSAADSKVTPQPLFMLSVATQALVLYFLVQAELGHAAIYLALSPVFSMTISPAMGCRGLLEHFILREGQETYSYYGPYNYLIFNAGYHTEHHDFVTIPWQNLPELRRIASSFYDTRYYHTEYFGLMRKFVRDDDLSLFNRISREYDQPQQDIQEAG